MIRTGSGLSAGQAASLAVKKVLGNGGLYLNRAVMTGAPTITLNTASSYAKYWPATSVNTANLVTGEYFTYVKARDLQTLGAGSTAVNAQNIKITSTPTYNSSNLGVLFDMDGQYLEIRMFAGSAAGRFLVKVNNEYISTTPTALVSGATRYAQIDFGSVAKRRIEVIMEATVTAFGGVYTEATATITPATPRGPSCCIVGDSFSRGTGASSTYGSLGSFVHYFGDYMGWDDVAYSGIGSTGYLADNTTNLKYRDHFQHDVIDNGYEVVIFTGGYNDANTSKTYAAMYAECVTLFSLAKTSLPNSTIVVFSPFWYSAVSTYTAALYDCWQAIEDAANATGCLYIDILEMDIPYQMTAQSGTLSDATLASATQFLSTTCFPVLSTVEVDTGSKRERIQIGAVTGPSSSKYTHTAYAGTLAQAHDAGATVTQVGGGFWTGVGNVAAATGVGNCDVYVTGGAGGVHPSDAGHEAIGAIVAKMVLAALEGAGA